MLALFKVLDAGERRLFHRSENADYGRVYCSRGVELKRERILVESEFQETDGDLKILGGVDALGGFIVGVNIMLNGSRRDGVERFARFFGRNHAETEFDLASVVGTAVIAIMVVFTFVWRFVGVVGPSMQPTLFENDWLAVSAVPRMPKAGDVVIVTQPNAFDEPIVKRVVATEGQTIDIREGHVFIDGEKIIERYIAPDVMTEREDLDNYPLTVPEGQVFVMGDNRSHSTDSRSSAIGLIDNDYILGRVSFRRMPFGKWKVGMEYDYT